jgi:hypothetical protein
VGRSIASSHFSSVKVFKQQYFNLRMGVSQSSTQATYDRQTFVANMVARGSQKNHIASLKAPRIPSTPQCISELLCQKTTEEKIRQNVITVK